MFFIFSLKTDFTVSTSLKLIGASLNVTIGYLRINHFLYSIVYGLLGIYAQLLERASTASAIIKMAVSLLFGNGPG
jgi:hypothetical protein